MFLSLAPDCFPVANMKRLDWKALVPMPSPHVLPHPRWRSSDKIKIRFANLFASHALIHFTRSSRKVYGTVYPQGQFFVGIISYKTTRVPMSGGGGSVAGSSGGEEGVRITTWNGQGPFFFLFYTILTHQ